MPGPPQSVATSPSLLDLEYVQGSVLGPCLLSLTSCCLSDPVWGLENRRDDTAFHVTPLVSNSPSDCLCDGSSWVSKPPLRKPNTTATECLLVGWRWPLPSAAQAKSLTFIRGAPPFPSHPTSNLSGNYIGCTSKCIQNLTTSHHPHGFHPGTSHLHPWPPAVCSQHSNEESPLETLSQNNTQNQRLPCAPKTLGGPQSSFGLSM